MKRIAAGLAWTLSIAWAGNYVALLTGLSMVFPAVVAVAIGAFVASDPLHRIWPRSIPRPTPTAASTATVEGLGRP